jgi:hypothetical protein
MTLYQGIAGAQRASSPDISATEEFWTLPPVEFTVYGPPRPERMNMLVSSRGNERTLRQKSSHEA